MNRRTILASAGVALTGTLAGCQNTLPSDKGPAEGGITYESSEFSPTLPIDREGPILIHLRSVSEFEQIVGVSESEHPEARAFVNDTDFESSMIIYIETMAPNTCHALRVQSVEQGEDGDVVGEAKSVDQSAADEQCAQMVVRPSRFVRITSAKGEIPTQAEFAVQDGWGEVKTVTSTGVEDFGSIEYSTE